MNNMYAMVLFLVVLASTSSTLCVSSNNDGDQNIFMVVDDQATVHDARIGMSKANPVQIGTFLLEDGKAFKLSRKLSPSKNCVNIDQPCGALDWCCEGLYCDGVFNGRCQTEFCVRTPLPCTKTPCCSGTCLVGFCA
ncbi:hypothetical protein CTI12_AA124470 [Artemisia annua]|uniref:Uncharacterized protein n=1 Tax=Artemisia annua TaxID=35608 RepID=A0A2U1PQ95_ARTAN|nr:hypothetical protein CTI12_AA124470 [Artemisia annua]